MTKRMLCLWLPDWAIQRRHSRQSEPEHASVVVYSHQGNRGSRVVARSLAAAHSGIIPGMPLAEAQGILGAASNSLFLEDDPVADLQALERLAQWCQRYSPIVSLDKSPRPESLFLDITGCGHLWGNDDGLAQDLLNSLARWGLTGRIAVTDTVGAAWAIVHFAKPAHCILPPAKGNELLLSLPVACLRLPEEILGTLHELGIVHVRELESLSRASLLARFDPILIQRLDQATGTAKELVTPAEPPAMIEVRHMLEYPLVHRELFIDIVQSLLREMLSQLRPGHGIVRMDLLLDHELPIPMTRLAVGLCRPSALLDHLLGLVRLTLDRTRLPAPTIGVRLQTNWMAPLEMTPAMLFDIDDARVDRHQVDTLLDRLVNRLGREHVRVARSTSDALPERACRFMAASDHQLAPSTRKSSMMPASSRDDAWRPLIVFDSPKPIVVRTLQPSGIPTTLCREGREGIILRSWGPERIQTGWWRGREFCRDYFRVELERGHRLWIFRDIAGGDWFLHGAFE